MLFAIRAVPFDVFWQFHGKIMIEQRTFKQFKNVSETVGKIVIN